MEGGRLGGVSELETNGSDEETDVSREQGVVSDERERRCVRVGRGSSRRGAYSIRIPRRCRIFLNPCGVIPAVLAASEMLLPVR